MDVAFHGGKHDDRPFFGPAPRLEQRPEAPEGQLHGLRRPDQLGQKIFTPLVALAHLGDGRDKYPVHDLQRVRAGGKLLFQQRGGAFLVALEHRVMEGRGNGGSRGVAAPDGGAPAAGSPVAKGADKGRGMGVMAAKGGHGRRCLAHQRRCRIGDAGGKAGPHGHAQEGRVQQGPRRKPERDIGKADGRGQMLPPAPPGKLQTLVDAFGRGGDRQRQNIHEDQTARYAQSRRAPDKILHDTDALGRAHRELPPLKRQQDKGRAVLPAERSQRFHAALFATDGIDEARTGTIGERRGNGLHIGGIERKRHQMPGDETLGQLREARDLIHERRPHIDVQDGRAGGHLLVREPQGLIETPFLKLRGQGRLARGIDALANDGQRFLRADTHKRRAAGEGNAAGGRRGTRRTGDGIQRARERGHMLGRRAAATAQHANAHGREGRRLLREALRTHGKDRLPVPQFRKAGIGFRHDGARAHVKQFPDHGKHLVRPEAAVGTHHIRAQILHGLGEDLRAGAGEAHPVLKGHGHHDRQVADLMRGGNGGARLREVELRFHKDEIGAAGDESPDLRREAFHQFTGFQRSQRTREKATRPHIAGHKDRTARAGRRQLRRLARHPRHAPADIEAVKPGGQLERIGAKGACGDDV